MSRIPEPNSIEFILSELRINPDVKDTYIYSLMKELHDSEYERGYEAGEYYASRDGEGGWIPSY